MKKSLNVISLCIFLFISSYTNSFTQQILINELMPSNSITITDEDGDYSDWIELYNPQQEAIDLTGYGISDDPSNPFKWIMPNVSIPSHDFLLIYASDKNINLHTNFKLSSEGETVVLTNPQGITVDQVSFGNLEHDVSFGRLPDGGDSLFMFQPATPGDSNKTPGYYGITEVSQVTPEAGFYSSSITVTITAGSIYDTVYYSLDGSEPDQNSILYTRPILISDTKVLRTRAYRTSFLPSKILTKTYFINFSSTLPVISLSTKPGNLFDEEYGIYSLGDSASTLFPYEGANFWKDWERPIHVELFETNGTDGFSVDAGVKIFGNYSRGYAQKSLAIFMRDKYGYSTLNYKLFKDLPFTKYEAFVLRNSGNDWPKTMFRDAMMTSLVNEVDIDKQNYRPAIVFINGEYWGIHNIREKVNEHFLAQHHNENPDDLDILEEHYAIVQGDNTDYLALNSFIENNSMTLSENYEYVKTKMEVDNFIRYSISEIYFDNYDWPSRNIKYWRNRNNGKWRWILYDTDFGFGLYYSTNYMHNSLEYATAPNSTEEQNPPWSTLFLRRLLENNSFKNDFINCFADYLNTIFSASVVLSKIDSIKSLIEAEIPRHGDRWNQFELNSWSNKVQVLRDFASQRIPYMQLHFAQKFGLAGMVPVNLTISNVDQGLIQINSILINTSNWTGDYFLGVPIKVVAKAKQGFHFVRWEGSFSSNEDTLSIVLSSPLYLTAVFEIDYVPSPPNVVINEINYNSSTTTFDPDDWIELYNNDDGAVDISGWVFKDEDDAHIFTIPQGTVLEKDGYIVLCVKTSKFHPLFPDVSNYIGDVGFGLSGNGELVRLYDAQMNIIDILTYDDNAPWPTEPDGKGPTLSLKNPELDNTLGENWTASLTNGTPGKVNDTLYGIPPSITSTAVTNTLIGQIYTYDVNASGSPLPTYSLVAFPTGMTIDTTTGIIEWTPNTTGEYEVTVKASNGVSPDATQTFMLTVQESQTGSCPPTLISYWKLDETSGSVYDDYVGTNDALSTETPMPVTGIVSGGQQFNGSSDRISASRIAAYDFDTNTSFTFEAWIKHASVPFSNEEVIVERKVLVGALAISLKFESSSVTFLVRNNLFDQLFTARGTKNLYDNEWHHVVGVRDAITNQIRLHVDGVLEKAVSAVFTAGFTSEVDGISIGWRKATNSHFFNGTIDEVAIYNDILDASAITQHYTDGLQYLGYCNEQTIPTAPIITSTAVTNATVGPLYKYDVNANGNPIPKYSLVSSPEGMIIDITTGLISWTPITLGEYEVTVKASNGVRPDAIQTFMLTVQESQTGSCPPSLLSYWKLDETSGSVYDDYVGSNDATSTDAPTPVSGRVSGGQQFNGSSDRINAARIAAYDFGVNTSFTLEVWIKHPASASSEEIIIERKTTSALAINLKLNSANTAIFSARNVTWQIFTATGTKKLNDGNWHHVVGVRDAITNQMRLYVDGVLENTVSAVFTAAFTSADEGISVGWRRTTNSKFFKGTIDEVAIYNDILDASVITQHYNDGLQYLGYCNEQTTPTAPVITSTAVTNATVGQLYTYDVNANGNPTPTYTLTTFPNGMTIDTTSGVIEWTPTAIGNFDVTVKAANGAGPDTTQTFSITVQESQTGSCPPTLISYWKLDETSGSVYDDYIGTNDATSTDAPTPVSGIVSGGQQFNGSSDRINAPRIAAYDFDTNTSFTFEAWIKHVSGSYTNEEVVVERKPSTGALAVSLKFESSSVMFLVRNNLFDQLYTAKGTKNLFDNNWHHVVGVRDAIANQLRIYVDGVLENTVSAVFTAAFTSTVEGISIGWRRTTNSKFFNGSIDEVAIYNDILDATAITQHYNDGLQYMGYCNEQTTPTAPIITSTAVTTTIVGQSYTYDVNASGRPIPTYSLITFPTGMTVDTTTGIIEWTPPTLGDYEVTVKASNGVSPDATQTFMLMVQESQTGSCLPSLLSYWKLDETSGSVYDDYVGTNDATSTDAPTPVSGRVSGGQQFNGSSDRINAARIAAYDFGVNTSFTLEVWIKHPASASSEEIIIERKTTSALAINLKLNSSNTAIFSARNVTWQIFTATGTKKLNDGNWHHVVGVRDANKNDLRLYVDGVLEKTVSAVFTSGFTSEDEGISIGWRRTTNSKFFNGSIDDVAIYNDILDASAITQHYNNGLLGLGYCQLTLAKGLIISNNFFGVFKNHVDRSTVQLIWETKSNVGIGKFEIERRSKLSNGATNWLKIGEVQSFAGSELKSYVYNDNMSGGGKFSYRIKFTKDGIEIYSDEIEAEILPTNYELFQNYPNPFNPITIIEYQLPYDSKVIIELYGITGEKVATLVNQEQRAGYYMAEINADELEIASGVYIYRMNAHNLIGNSFVQVKKLLLAK